MYDEDCGGTFDAFELREALTDSGYTLSAGSLGTVVRLFASQDGQIYVDGFIRCMAQLKRTASKAETGVRGEKQEAVNS